MRPYGAGQTPATVLIMDRPGYFCCVCPDSGLLHDELECITSTAAKDVSAVKRLVFWGDDDLPPHFWEALTLQSFEPALRIIILRNAQNLSADVLRTLSKALGKPNPQAFCTVCLEGAWEKGQPKLPDYLKKLPFVSFAHKQGWWKEIPGLSPSSLPGYIKKLAAVHNLSLAPGTLEALCDALPLNAAAVSTEMDKLALYATQRGHDNRTLTAADTALLGAYSEFNIFQIIRLLQRGQNTAVWKAIAEESPDTLLFPLLGLLQRESRILWQLLAGENPYIDRRDLATKKELASRIGRTGLGRLWDAMHSAELSVKSGKESPEQALHALITETLLIFSPHTRL